MIIGFDMMTACVPSVVPVTMERVIHVESRDNPLALNTNVKWAIERDEKGQPIMVTGKDGQSKPKRREVMFKWPTEVRTKQDAVIVTYTVMAGGSTVDTSYTQVNSSNPSALGFTVEDMFDDCKDLAVNANVLSAFYARASKEHPGLQTVLRAALSAYNTGDFNKGYLDSYLARYEIGNPAVSVPAINSYTVDMTMFVCQSPKKEEAMNTKEEANSTQQVAKLVKAAAPRVNPVMSQSQEDGATPGAQVEYTAGTAEVNGAFHGTAMSESDVRELNVDLTDDPSGIATMLKGKVVRPATPRGAADLAKAQPMKGGN